MKTETALGLRTSCVKSCYTNVPTQSTSKYTTIIVVLRHRLYVPTYQMDYSPLYREFRNRRTLTTDL